LQFKAKKQKSQCEYQARSREIALDSLNDFGYFYRLKKVWTMGYFFRTAPPRAFKYKPRYDDSGSEAAPGRQPVGRRRRFHFRRLLRHPREAAKPMVLWIFLAIISFFLYWQMNQYAPVSEPIQAEEVVR
jgi:hypothetical protein